MYPNMTNTQKLQDSEPVIRKSTVMMQDPCIRPKYRSSPINTHSLASIPSKNVGSLFDLIPETQRQQCLCDNKSPLPYLGLVILCLLGFSDADRRFLAKKL
jgi:hypothetical protein